MVLFSQKIQYQYTQIKSAYKRHKDIKMESIFLGYSQAQRERHTQLVLNQISANTIIIMTHLVLLVRMDVFPPGLLQLRLCANALRDLRQLLVGVTFGCECLYNKEMKETCLSLNEILFLQMLWAYGKLNG